MEANDLRVSHIESFEGHGYWHLIFHYAASLPAATAPLPGRNVKAIEWFPLDHLPPAVEVAHEGWGLDTLGNVLGST